MNAATRPETAALAVAPRQQFDLSPQTFEQALSFSKYLAESEMVPKGYRGKPGDCLIAMQWGFEVGLKPLQALQSIATINGKPGLFGDAGKALLLAAGCLIEEDDTAVVKQNQRGRCKITRPGRPPVERTFSVEDATTANLWGKEGPWKTYPWRQMAWRAFWFAARDAASDLLRGLPGAEEAMDIPTERHMGAVQEVGAPPPPPQTYDQAKFDHNFPSWSKVVAAGTKTAEDYITFNATRGTPLSDAQAAQLRAVKVDKGADATDVQVKTPAATAAQPADAPDLEQRIAAAESQDELTALDEPIGAVADPARRASLAALVNERREKLPPF